MINWGEVTTGVLIAACSSALTFIFGKLWKLSHDMNHAFFKIRQIQKELGIDDGCITKDSNGNSDAVSD